MLCCSWRWSLAERNFVETPSPLHPQSWQSGKPSHIVEVCKAKNQEQMLVSHPPNNDNYRLNTKCHDVTSCHMALWSVACQVTPTNEHHNTNYLLFFYSGSRDKLTFHELRQWHHGWVTKHFTIIISDVIIHSRGLSMFECRTWLHLHGLGTQILCDFQFICQELSVQGNFRLAWLCENSTLTLEMVHSASQGTPL